MLLEILQVKHYYVIYQFVLHTEAHSSSYL